MSFFVRGADHLVVLLRTGREPSSKRGLRDIGAFAESAAASRRDKKGLEEPRAP
jgi:hypothetical protein